MLAGLSFILAQVITYQRFMLLKSRLADAIGILQAFLNSQAVKEALNQSQSALAAITVLKKICVHPHLLSERAADAVAKGGEPPVVQLQFI